MQDALEQKPFVLIEIAVILLLVVGIVLVWLNLPIGGSDTMVIDTEAIQEETQTEQEQSVELTKEQKHQILESLKNTTESELSTEEKLSTLENLRTSNSNREELTETEKHAILEGLRGE